MTKMTRSEVLQELNELIHDYPVWFPSAVRQGLKDALAALETEDEDAAKVRQIREGHVVKSLGRGVVILNWQWWVKVLEDLGEFKPVPSFEDLHLIDADKLYQHFADLQLTYSPDDRTEPEEYDFRNGIREGLEHAMAAVLEAEGRKPNETKSADS